MWNETVGVVWQFNHVRNHGYWFEEQLLGSHLHGDHCWKRIRQELVDGQTTGFWRKICSLGPSKSAAYWQISLESPVKPMSFTPYNRLRKSSRASASTFNGTPSRNLQTKKIPLWLKWNRNESAAHAESHLVSRRKATAFVVITAVALAQSYTTCRDMLSTNDLCSSRTMSVPYSDDDDGLCCRRRVNELLLLNGSGDSLLNDLTSSCRENGSLKSIRMRPKRECSTCQMADMADVNDSGFLRWPNCSYTKLPSTKRS